MSNFPNNLKYNKDFSWIKVEEDVATIGITQLAASKVEEFVFLILPKKGAIKIGDTYATAEAIKWSGHFSSPIKGEVIEVNDAVFDSPSLINEDAYSNWIAKIKIEEIEELMDHEEAIKHYSKL